jgi:hypothetical protein
VPGAFVTVLTIRMLTAVPTQVSVAVGGSKFHALPHSTDLFGAQVGTGGVVSTTVTICSHVERLLHGSSISQTRVAV